MPSYQFYTPDGDANLRWRTLVSRVSNSMHIVMWAAPPPQGNPFVRELFVTWHQDGITCKLYQDLLPYLTAQSSPAALDALPSIRVGDWVRDSRDGVLQVLAINVSSGYVTLRDEDGQSVILSVEALDLLTSVEGESLRALLFWRLVLRQKGCRRASVPCLTLAKKGRRAFFAYCLAALQHSSSVEYFPPILATSRQDHPPSFFTLASYTLTPYSVLVKRPSLRIAPVLPTVTTRIGIPQVISTDGSVSWDSGSTLSKWTWSPPSGCFFQAITDRTV